MYSENYLTDWFIRNWTNRPLFRTTLIFTILATAQALLLRFGDSGFGIINWLNVWINMLREYAGVGIVALGMTFVIVCGGVDLSAGAAAAAVSAVVILFVDSGQHGILQILGINGTPAYAAAVCAGIIFGAFLGFVTGFIVTRGNIPSFIVTLGMMMIYRSLTQHIMTDITPDIPTEFKRIALTEAAGMAVLPIMYWIILAALLHIILKRTVFGKYIIAVGSSEKAAWLAGVNVNRVKRRVYMLAGVLTAITAIIQVSAAGTPDYGNAGSGYATEAIAACVLGGTRLGGGRGYIAGAIMGTMIIAVINNMPGLMSISPYMRDACKGAVIIMAVLLQRKKYSFEL